MSAESDIPILNCPIFIVLACRAGVRRRRVLDCRRFSHTLIRAVRHLNLATLALVVAAATSHAASPTPTFFVATNGNDRWSGTLPSPNEALTDGPFATPAKAVNASRAWRQLKSNTNRTCSIGLRDGIWFLSDPLTLRSKDSNLLLEAYQGETPVLSGGRKITGFKAVETAGRKMWVASIPDAVGGHWFFHELWVNGKRAVRARHPNHGYLSVEALPDKTSAWTEGHSRFRFAGGDLLPLLETNPPPLTTTPPFSSAEVIAMTRWVESRLPISGVDATERFVSFSKRSVFQLAPGDPYYVENFFAAMDEPGEWFLERQSGRLYYLPRPGERLSDVQVIAPLLTQVVRLEGFAAPGTQSLTPGSGITNVTFRGLTFSHTEWNLPEPAATGSNVTVDVSPTPHPDIGGFSQAAVGVPAAVWGEGIRWIAFVRCAFSHLGNYGLELSQGCQSNLISHCEFSDLGAGGLKIGETVLRPEPARQTRANEISDCHIHDGGLLFASAVGIWLGHSPDNRILHNSVHDFYYTGISIGWSWGYNPAMASNNLVQLNHIHHIGVKSDGDGPILSDMAGIYILGLQPGTKIVNNLWHDIAAIRYGGWGIYFDEGSSGILAASNVVYRTTHGGFHQHYGETNMVWNNIFAFGRDAQIQRTRPEKHRSFSFATNIVYFDSGNLLAGDWSDENFFIDGNVYCDARAQPSPLTFSGATLEEWRKRGHDLNSVLADPQFISPAQNGFDLQPGSPAFKLGFKPINLTIIGPR